MKIGIQTWGSEGDIRPMVALGHGLVQRGHDVELVYTDIANRQYEQVAASLGMTARAVATPVIADENELYEIGLRVINARNPLVDGKIVFDRLLRPVEDAIFAAAVDLCRRSDIIVSHLVLNQVRAAAELAGKPAVSVTFAHTIVPSRHNRPQGLPRLGEVANAAAWAVGRFMLNRVMLGPVNDFRRRVGVPIREITARAGTGYATFFRHYPDKEALLGDVASQEIANLIAMVLPILSSASSAETTTALCRHVAKYRKLWSALLTGGAAGILREEFIRQARVLAEGMARPDSWLPADLAVVYATGATIDLLAWWLARIRDYPADQIAAILDRLIIAPLLDGRPDLFAGG